MTADISDDQHRRLDFFGICDSDFRRSSKIGRLVRKLAPAALDRLYRKVISTSETAAFFKTPGAIDHARGKQLEHWGSLFSGRTGLAYFQSAERIGQVHARIGLSPTWYIGGYALVLERMIRKMAGSPLVAFTGGGRLIGTLVKLALLDMDIALSAYFKAEEASRLAVIDQLGVALAALASGDFTARLEGLPEAYRQVETDFENMRAGVEQALEAVAAASQTINGGASQIEQASGDLAQRTERQAASLEETAASIEQLALGVQRTADDGAHMAKTVDRAESEARQGSEVAQDAVKAMEGLQRYSQDIAKITDVIDAIAFQTSLLALNAGVEAARAGDAGRGFAVVATEVRALAQRSAEAASEIKALISSSTQHVDSGAALVSRSGAAFDSISMQVTEIAKLTASIANLSTEQSQHLQQINIAVREMDTMTQQNAAMVEESSAASRSLASEAVALQGLLSRFHTADSTGTNRHAPHARRAAIVSIGQRRAA